MKRLSGKVVVITGAARGIGRAIALRLAGEGANVALVTRSSVDKLAEVAQTIEAANGQALTIQADVSGVDDAKRIISETTEKFGRIDILVNNAGITKDNLLVRLKERDWDDVINVNLKGTFNCLKAAARPMMRQRSGKIINITSVVGIMGNAGQVNYAASKAGIIGLTKSAAKELSAWNITVNAVAPGFVETDMTESLPEDAKNMMLQWIPLKRPGQPADVAGVVAFLCSEDADYITGQIVQVDGGMRM
ncbi:3-oxoacyl-[acyl-carrier-protein] reductase FabG [bacterium BMS3Abin05]|nr:3-oxoacyl-[acyl-carrier-protein] reductase FabG [bacterium BMS3Abin05]GBE27110.1 3-oxoacyl-[acyl-carrier-protein] reductase FabG [bacterium BMS3Bbin03]HDZ11026.1 3-oxoacyl-[acyl-carrier-protein] reductase [Bacteroidota bacterium]